MKLNSHDYNDRQIIQITVEKLSKYLKMDHNTLLEYLLSDKEFDRIDVKGIYISPTHFFYLGKYHKRKSLLDIGELFELGYEEFMELPIYREESLAFKSNIRNKRDKRPMYFSSFNAGLIKDYKEKVLIPFIYNRESFEIFLLTPFKISYLRKSRNTDLLKLVFTIGECYQETRGYSHLLPEY